MSGPALTSAAGSAAGACVRSAPTSAGKRSRWKARLSRSAANRGHLRLTLRLHPTPRGPAGGHSEWKTPATDPAAAPDPVRARRWEPSGSLARMAALQHTTPRRMASHP